MSTGDETPAWVVYPGEDWETIAPAEAGLDEQKWAEFLKLHPLEPSAWEGETHGDDEWGCALSRGGYLLQTWGDPDYKWQTASLGKAFTWAVLGLAVDNGMVEPDRPIHETWTGQGQLSHPHKCLNVGHHVKLTWRHLIGDGKDNYEHRGGFPLTNGYYWRQGSAGYSQDTAGSAIPEWANWTGDPMYDNYSHAEPATVGCYSSGGFWRLSQALTVLWGRDIKAVIDERIFSRIGVPADRWEWTPGRVVHEQRDWYPHMPDYGEFLDPPYEIGGNVVRGGPGWVAMSSKDLARFGLLVATQGVWRGECLIGRKWIRGHFGGNDSYVDGESTHYTSIGKVTAKGTPFPLPDELFVGPILRPRPQ